VVFGTADEAREAIPLLNGSASESAGQIEAGVVNYPMSEMRSIEKIEEDMVNDAKWL
jgi:hypothetical protein